MEKTVTIPVYGMSCEHCVKAATSALNAVKGVKEVRVSLENKEAQVVYDDDTTSLGEMESASLKKAIGLRKIEIACFYFSGLIVA